MRDQPNATPDLGDDMYVLVQDTTCRGGSELGIYKKRNSAVTAREGVSFGL